MILTTDLSTLSSDFSHIQNFSIYIHIPLCKSICGYCDFPRVKSSTDFNEIYVNNLLKKIRFYGDLFSISSIDTVYIGGGTPSFLGPELLESIVTTLFKSFNLSTLKEFTVELNPDDVSPSLLESLLNLGVTRVSMGIQTFFNPERLGRRHSSQQALDAIRLLNDYEFVSFNTDLIFALPDSVPDELKRNLEILTGLKVPHISAYGLTLGEHSNWTELYYKGSLNLPDEEIWVNDFYFVKDYLESKGYHHYEISNYALAGHESKHNQIYWNGGNWLGIGSGASSSMGYFRFSDDFPPEVWIYKCEENKFLPETIEKITLKEEWTERILSGLRKLSGISVPEDWFSDEIFRGTVRKLLSENFITVEDNQIRITRNGLIQSDNIIFSIIETLDSIFKKQ